MSHLTKKELEHFVCYWLLVPSILLTLILQSGCMNKQTDDETLLGTGVSITGSPLSTATMFVPADTPASTSTVTAAKSTPTESPTTEVPVVVSSPQPLPGPISASNAWAIQELGRFGKGNISSFAWSPDSSLLALGTTLGVYLFKTDTLTQASFLSHTAKVGDIVFASDGRTLFSVSDDSVAWMWNLVTGEVANNIKISDDPLINILKSPDEHNAVISSFLGVVWLWDIQQNQAYELGGERKTDTKYLLAFSSDGSRLIVFAHDLEVWNMETKSRISGFDFDGDYNFMPWGSAISPNGELLARVMYDGRIELWGEIWSKERPRLLRTFSDSVQVAPYSVCATAFSPDSRILTAQGAGKIWLWNVDDGEPVAVLETDVLCSGIAAFDPGSSLLAFAGMQSERSPSQIYVWTIGSDQLRTVDWEFGAVRDWTFSPDGKALVFINTIGEVWLWNQSGEKTQMLEHDSNSRTVRYSLDGDFFAVAQGAKVRLVATDSGQTVGELEHKAPITSLEFGSDGSLVVLDETGRLVFWQTREQVQLRTCQVGEGVRLLTPSLDGEWMAWARGRTVELWKASSCEHAYTLEGYDSDIIRIEFSPDSNVLGAGSVNQVQLWRVPDGSSLRSFETESGIWDIHWNQEVARVAVVKRANHKISVYDVASDAQLQILAELKDYSAKMSSLRFSRDGSVLVAADEYGVIHVWDVTTGNSMRRLEGHRYSGTDLVFSPDGSVLVSSNRWDGTVRMWGLPTVED
ncbi:MAG: hypothetical protein JXA89_19775 [Anaerolineae bacterium]|nr:hypothetical protein [Anaerolineae bacterium]